MPVGELGDRRSPTGRFHTSHHFGSLPLAVVLHGRLRCNTGVFHFHLSGQGQSVARE